jgi:N-acetylneuraminic acid mutarotase
MYAQVNDEGNIFQLLDEIMDHKKDNTAIDIANGTVTMSSGNVKPKITTQGWQFLVLWKDKLMSWVKLKDLKASNSGEATGLRKNQLSNGGYLTLCVSGIILSQR